MSELNPMASRKVTVLTFGPHHDKPWWWDHIAIDPTRCEIRYIRLSMGNKREKDLSLLRMVPLALRIVKLLFGKCRNDNYIVTFEAGILSFIISLIQTLTFMRSPKHVILQFIMREKNDNWSSKFKYIFMKACFSSLHMAVCSSRREVKYYSKVFKWNSGKVRFVPVHTDPNHFDNHPNVKGDFVFSGGKTYRDYDVLIKAVDGISIQTVIVCSKTYRPSIKLPPNVSLMRDIPLDEFNRLLGNCRFLVLPLEDREISTGQIVLLQAMAMGKAVIATKTSGTVDYIEDGVDGILVTPHDSKDLRKAIVELMRNDEIIARLSANAKKSAREKYMPQQYLETISTQLISLG